MSNKSDYCPLCGLLCTLSTGSGCPRRDQRAVGPGGTQAKLSHESTQEIVRQLRSASRSLIWLDAVDVDTTRAAVELSKSCGAVLHVGHDTGSQIVHRVLRDEQWLSTSLAELRGAELIVTLGSTILSESPLLVQRFIQPACENGSARWLHISPFAETPPVIADRVIELPHTTWYRAFSELLFALREAEHAVEPQELAALHEQLTASKNTIFVWDSSEFSKASDELTIRRIADIARVVTEQSRCSLLALDNSPGRVTAQETLLWLTGCSTTAQWDRQRWLQPTDFSLLRSEQYHDHFETILLVRSVSSLNPLPRIAPTACLLPDAGVGRSQLAKNTIWVAGVGDTAAGHLMRGDRNLVLPIGAPSHDHVSAPAVLRDIAHSLASETEN